MRLKRLELQGFKSFLDRTILNFDPGITGVVGPNGCGKSNIVDAIQWVMGEQSAKHLRGEAMTDVIFNGSDTRAATSMAEVSLILEKQGVPLSPQFAVFDKGDEISITRRVYRDGTGEFLINKTTCRLKDIHELFMDTGVGRRAYSIIEQGQIDRMINVKPEERRFLFEEVAGITKYKVKRKEAERKLELTRGNLTRVHDITTELEKQIRSLKVQASRARNYKELKGEMEAVDLFLLGRNLFSHKKNIDEAQGRREELISLRSESDAAFGQMDAEVTELEVQRLEQERALQEASQRERDLSLLIQKLESQMSLFDQRREHLKQSRELAGEEIEELESQVAELHTDRENSTAERESLSESLRTLETEVTQGESQVRNFQNQKFLAKQRLDSAVGSRNRLAQKTVSLANQKQNAQSRDAEISQTIAELEGRLAEVATSLEGFNVNIAETDAKIASVGTRADQAKQEQSEIQVECQEISQRLHEIEELLFKTREEFHAKRSRLQSLTELQENLEGYSPTAREILQGLEGTGISATPLAEVLQPDAEIEDHLELLLGNDMNTLLVNESREAEGLARMIEEKGMERVRVLALSEIAAAAEGPETQVEGAVPILSRIRVKEGYLAAARWWLGGTYLAPSMDAVFELRTGNPHATLLAEGSRTISHDDRSLSAGAMPTKTGVFARRREIEELTVESAALEARVAGLNDERETTLQHLKTQEAREEQLKDTLSSLHIESVEFRKEREKFQVEISRSDRDRQNVARDIERQQSQLEGLREQVVGWTEELESVTAEETKLGEEIAAMEAEIAGSAQEFEALVTRINERKIERSRLTERMSSIEYKFEKIKSDIAQLTMRRDNLLTQRERDEEELVKIDESVEGVRIDSEERHEEKNATLVRISDTKEAFNETCTRLQDLRERRGDLQKKRETTLSEINELELKITQEQLAFEHVRGISMERYLHEAVALDEAVEIDLSKLPLFVSGLEVEWAVQQRADQLALLQEHLKKIREKVARYGEVNLTAIQEFEEIQKRYDFLIEQRTDLEKSIQILEEAITKIDESTKARFAETFEAVDKKFREIFPILFNGGKAELTLTNSENVLEAGVDITVHPPGKRPASITLLSGGEKALTAVSLILAIFARKPSPFCLLDEVDAPLDDANVSRFNTVVRKMAEKTQFIVITHNKKTMEIAEALYGVTMEKPGISKMTSVRLN